jgi:iron complex outermembrane recepter protein
MKLRYRSIIVTVFATALSVSLHAQAAPPPPPEPETPTNADAAKEQALELPKFTVSSEKDSSYLGKEALSTTRIGVPLTDLSQSVTVLNRALIEDIDPTIIAKSFVYVGGAQTGTINWSVDRSMIRGFVGEGDYVDGFRTQTDRNTDLNIIDHAELIKGPSAIFIGNTANTVGGVLNKVSKSPTSYRVGTLTVQMGLFDANRADLDIGGPLTADKKLMFRLLLNRQDSKGYYKHTYDNRSSITPMVEYKFSTDTDVWVKFEKFTSHYSSYNGIPLSGQTANGLPMGQGGVAIPGVTNQMLNIPWKTNLNEDTPLNWRTDRFWRLWGQFTTRLNSHVAVRLAAFDSADWQRRVESILAPAIGGGQGTPVVDASGQLIGWNPSYVVGPTFVPGVTKLNRTVTAINPDYQPRREVQNDYIINFETGPVGHKLLTGFDAIDFPETTKTYSGIGTTSPIDPFNPVFPGTVSVNVDQQPPPSFLDQTQTFAKVYALEMASFFNDRANISFGAIRNRVDLGRTTTTYSAATGVSTTSTVPDQVLYKNLTQFGALVKPLPNLSVFYGQSQNFANNGFDPQNRLQPPQVGRQREVGIKSNWFKNRLTANVSYFDVKQLNNSVPAFPQTVPPSNVLVPGTISRGFDGEWTAKVSNNIDLIGAFSNFKAHVPLPAPYNKINQPADGVVRSDLPVNNVAQKTWAISGRYKFTDATLKGLALQLGVNWLDKRAITDNPNLEFYGYVPARTLADAMIQYDTPRIKYQLNFDNIFNKKYIYASRSNQVIVPGTPTNVRLSVTYKFW